MYEEFKYKVNTSKMVKARKSHTCEKCGKEIPKGDYYYIFKPYPRFKGWYTWRKRCIDDKPLYYDEIFYYEDHDSRLQQFHLLKEVNI